MMERQGALPRVLAEALPDAVAKAYAELITEGGHAPSNDEGSLDGELIARGLAYVHTEIDGRMLRPTEPVSAVAGMLAHLHTELTAQHERLRHGYTELAELQREFEHRHRENDPSALVQVLTDRHEITERSGTLIVSTRRSYLSINTLNFDVPLTEDNVLRPPPGAVERGVSFRKLYAADYLTDSVAASTLRASVAAGVEARTLPDLPLKLVIVDDDTALVALTATGMGGALLVRSTALIGALRQYFELLWNRATPVPVAGQADRAGGGLAARDKEILALMAHGLKDEAIARRLDLSLRTVRRRITAVMEELHVATRFAAGVAAQRQGLLD